LHHRVLRGGVRCRQRRRRLRGHWAHAQDVPPATNPGRDGRSKWLEPERPQGQGPGGMSDFAWTIQLIYLLAASSFVFGLHPMNTPAPARRGNQASTIGMVVAIAATLAIIVHDNLISTTGWIVMTAGALVGSALGLYSARNVQMTAMPQLVSMFNAVGGG